MVVLPRSFILFFCLLLPVLAQDTGMARLTAGLEQSSAGSAAPVEKLSVRLFFTEPLNPRLSAWGDLRLSSLPTAISSTAATLPTDVVKLVTATPPTQLVRTGEVLTGASYRLYGGTGMWSTVHAIASIGAAMPLSPATALPANQNRFWRQYYGGVRIASTQRSHIVDVTLGQNEAVTGGRFQGAVLRIDGFYALPLNNGNSLYLFGTAMMRASPRTSPSDTGADSYRIGVAVDVAQMLKALRIN
jgi:hypothetical protein